MTNQPNKPAYSATAPTSNLFVLAGYCAPNQPIPYALLQGAAGLDEERCDEVLDLLIGLGLLQLEHPDTGPTIHPLLAEYARNPDSVI